MRAKFVWEVERPSMFLCKGRTLLFVACRKKAPKVDISNLPPEEVARRRRQRQLAELAKKLRAEGKEYKRKGPKNKPKIRRKGTIQVGIVAVLVFVFIPIHGS